MSKQGRTGAVVIGKNEGQKLADCLASLTGQVDLVVYVDSGSTDASVAIARAAGAQVVELDTGQPFTAARARNAGFACLMNQPQTYDMVQFVDGDCVLQAGWVATAWRFLTTQPKAAAVFGHLRERFPDASIYNRLADAEWRVAPGLVTACGGVAAFRVSAFQAVGGFDPAVRAGEEPELCVRLRAQDWQIWSLDAEMGLHDIDMHRFGQWWRRSRRAGFAYAQGAAMHGAAPERHKVTETRRAVLWGIGLPLLTCAGLLVSPWALLLLLVWPLQVLRLRLRGLVWAQAFFLTLSKLPEALGVLDFLKDYRRRRALKA